MTWGSGGCITLARPTLATPLERIWTSIPTTTLVSCGGSTIAHAHESWTQNAHLSMKHPPSHAQRQCPQSPNTLFPGWVTTKKHILLMEYRETGCIEIIETNKWLTITKTIDMLCCCIGWRWWGLERKVGKFCLKKWCLYITGHMTFQLWCDHWRVMLQLPDLVITFNR